MGTTDRKQKTQREKSHTVSDLRSDVCDTLILELAVFPTLFFSNSAPCVEGSLEAYSTLDNYGVV